MCKKKIFLTTPLLLAVVWIVTAQQDVLQMQTEQQTVNCSATVPPAGQTGVFVQFLGTASLITYPGGTLVDTDPIVGKLFLAPAGTFTQGSPTSEDCREGDERQFTHTLTKNLAVMETAVTRKMWNDLRALQSSLPADPTCTGYSSGLSDPVQCITWYHAVLFANLLSQQRGLRRVYYVDAGLTGPIDSSNYQRDTIFADWSAAGFRLPTEGEREYFTRAGNTGIFWLAENMYTAESCSRCPTGVFRLAALEDVAWFCGIEGTHPVGTKGANPWGFKDVHGNVYEWCWDLYDHSYPTGTQTDYRGAGSTEFSYRVIRGGAWNEIPRSLRSAKRIGFYPPSISNSVGFRLVRSVGSSAQLSEQAGTTWDWYFGDGTPNSNLQNPTHVYNHAGTYPWIMRVTINGISCSQGGKIIIAYPPTIITSTSTTTTRATSTTTRTTTTTLRPTTTSTTTTRPTTTTTTSTTTTTLGPRYFSLQLPLAAGTAAPCYYIADVSLAANGNSGSFGIEILMNRGRRKLAGGLNFGGAFAADGTRESFAAFNISNDRGAGQVVRIELDAQALPTAGRNPGSLQLQVQVLDGQKKLVAGPFPTSSTGTAGIHRLVTEVTLQPGFYSINVKSVSGSPMGTFQLGATTKYSDGGAAEFDGGAVVGGYLTRDGSGKSLSCFVGFCLGEEQDVGVNLYHYDGIGPLVLRVKNSDQTVVFDSQNAAAITIRETALY